MTLDTDAYRQKEELKGAKETRHSLKTSSIAIFPSASVSTISHSSVPGKISLRVVFHCNSAPLVRIVLFSMSIPIERAVKSLELEPMAKRVWR